MILRTPVSIIAVLILCFQSILPAQRLPESLNNSQFEVGYSHYWYHGNFYHAIANQSQEDWWNNGTIYFRVGLYDLLSVSIEGMAFTVSPPGEHSSGSFLNLTMGCGLSSVSYKVINFKVSVQIHYLENLYLDRSTKKSDKIFTTLLLGFPIRYKIDSDKPTLFVWFAPVFKWEKSEYFEDQYYSELSEKFGISIGLDLLIFEHLYLNMHTVYTNFFQPHLTIGYRFQ